MRTFLKLSLLVGLALVGTQASTVDAQQSYTKVHRLEPFQLQPGDDEVMLRLGYMYSSGRGVPHDDAQAAQWFRRAGDLGQTNAMYSLAMCYWAGRGVSQDYVEAYKWLDLVAARSMGPERDWASMAQVGIARVMSQAQLDEARKRARDWQSAFEKRK